MSRIPIEDAPVHPWIDRAVGIVVVLTAAGLVLLLARATPDPSGFNTHVQLGMQPCGWPAAHGIPCPTCGVTTSACLLVHGRILDALLNQPFGAVATAAGLGLAAWCAFCLARGRSIFAELAMWPLWRGGFIAILLLLASWLYKYLVFRAR